MKLFKFCVRFTVLECDAAVYIFAIADLPQCENDGLCSCLTEDVQQKCQCPDKDSGVCKPTTPSTGIIICVSEVFITHTYMYILYAVLHNYMYRLYRDFNIHSAGPGSKGSTTDIPVVPLLIAIFTIITVIYFSCNT